MKMEDWHLSRNVPIAIFLALVVQAVSVSGAFREVEVGVAQNAKDITGLESTIQKLDANQRAIELKLARIDENIIQMYKWMEQDQQ